jgi:CTP synthase (UTP-ammonia lyase)
VEYARNVAGVASAAHAEVGPDAEHEIIRPLACSLVGESRIVHVVPGTRAAAICGPTPMIGYHQCAYGLDPAWIPKLEAAGLVVSGRAEDAGVEIVELRDHPFYIATLFQPQAGPDDERLHPLLVAFATAIVRHHASRA